MDDLEDLMDELPTLAAVPAFVQMVQAMPWFRSLGEVPDRRLNSLAQDYVDTLGFPEAVPAFFPEWEDAAAAAETQDFNSSSWEAEEQARAVLTEALINTIGEDVFSLVMNHIASSASEVIGYGAEEAQEFLRIEDEEFVAAAIGAGAQAVHQAALVMLTGVDEDHPFAVRFKLFEAGRWPIGIIGGSFAIY